MNRTVSSAATAARQTKPSLRSSHSIIRKVRTGIRTSILVLACLLIAVVIWFCVTLSYLFSTTSSSIESQQQQQQQQQRLLLLEKNKKKNKPLLHKFYKPNEFVWNISQHVLDHESSAAVDNNDNNKHTCGLVLDSTLLQELRINELPILTTAFSSATFIPQEEEDQGQQDLSIMFLFSLTHLSQEDYIEWYHSKWYCGDNNQHRAAQVLGSPPTLTSMNRHVLIISCPSSSASIQQLSVRGPKHRFVYYEQLDSYYKCQTQHHPLTRHFLKQELLKKMKVQQRHQQKYHYHVVAGTMVQGQASQALIPQWVEYHRLYLKVQHFFIYINEPIAEFRERPLYYEKPYITYIPFGFHSRQAFFYQQVQQTDLIWRLKGRVEWVAMLDVDEYIVAPPSPKSPSLEASSLVDDNNNNNNNNNSNNETVTTSSSSAQLRFHKLLTEYEESSTDIIIGGIAMPNVFWGVGPDQFLDQAKNATAPATSAITHLPLSICDYTWHGSITKITRFFQRQKLLVRPAWVEYFSVHHITLGHATIKMDPLVLRMHHFKQPHRGPKGYSVAEKSNPNKSHLIVQESLELRDACQLLKQQFALQF
jgi:hypothetical protein